MSLSSTFLPRPLHPGAWWIWALGLAVAASRTTNPLLLGLILAVAGFVVAARRPSAPWARSYRAFLMLGLTVLAIRMAFQIVFGATGAGHVVFSLPQVPLPGWAVGIRIGGPVTTTDLLTAFYEGLRLATLLACVGAANSLANPSRLLRVVPGALYEVGVAVVVAMTLAPQMIGDVSRVRQARRLRGRPERGLRAVTGTAIPVLEGALDRSLQLAAAMDARGYGRTAGVPRRTRRLTAVLVLGGLLGACLGAYGLLDGGVPDVVGLPVIGLPLLLAGTLCAGLGFLVAGRRTVRTAYRPDPWALPEWLVSGSGVVAGVTLVAAFALNLQGLVAPVAPPGWPALPIVPALSILVALLPAWAAPAQPAAVAATRSGGPSARRDPAFPSSSDGADDSTRAAA